MAVIGFSWGGISNLFAAARDQRIGALVALDGSLRYRPGLVRRAGIRPERMAVPLLYLAQGEVTLEELARRYTPEEGGEPSVLNAWTGGDLLLVRMLGLTHREFSSMFQRSEDIWKDAAEADLPMAMKADYTREDGIVGYSWVARYTLQFLEAHLKASTRGEQFLGSAPSELGAPPHFIAREYRRAQGPPMASLEELRARVASRGFLHLGEIVADLRRLYPGFMLHEVALSAWAEELLDAGNADEAIGLLALNTEMHPDSAMAQVLLGRALQWKGEQEDAARCYRMALEIDPRNAEARRRSRALGVQDRG